MFLTFFFIELLDSFFVMGFRLTNGVVYVMGRWAVSEPNSILINTRPLSLYVCHIFQKIIFKCVFNIDLLNVVQTTDLDHERDHRNREIM